MTPLLIKIFRLNTVYVRKTFMSLLTDGLLITLVLVTISQFLHEYWPVIIPIFAVVAYLILRSIIRTILVKRRTKLIPRIAGTRGGLSSLIALSAAEDEFKTINRSNLLAEGPEWRLYEIEVDFYRRTKYGRYLHKQVFYTIFEIKLRRQVPNIIFDSKTAKGQQFRYLYAKSQRLSLEGDFDAYFQAYAPQHYKIDMLSFISPEVMHALIQARSYDIELVSDRLLLYGPILFSMEDLTRMQVTGQHLAHEINDNLDTYADSYLSGTQRYTTTTTYARQLLESPFKLVIGLCICVVLIGLIVYGGITISRGFFWNEISALIYALTIGFIYGIIQIQRTNARAEKKFRDGIRAAPAPDQPQKNNGA